MADVKILTPQERLADPVIYADILRRVRQGVALAGALEVDMVKEKTSGKPPPRPA